MNELQMKVFSPKQLSQLKEVKPDEKWQGFFYVVEYGDYIKIGSSINPYNRYRTFVGEARYGQKKMGRIAISCSHANFRQNEHRLHRHYSEYRIDGTELFKLPFKKVVKECWKLLEYEFLDSTNEEGNINNLERLLTMLWGDKAQIEKRKFALLTALLANCPLLAIGDYNESLIIDDLQTAAEGNKSIKECLTELSYLIAVPFIKSCRKAADKPSNITLKEKTLKVGEEVLKHHVEIPLELINVMEEGGIYDFS